MDSWNDFLSAETLREASPPPRWPAPDGDAWIVPCTHLTPIIFSGDDALAFLQGQLTNDIDALDAHGLQLNGYCSPKGRLLALFWLFRREDSVFALTRTDIAADVCRRLRMYVLRAKVTIDWESEYLVTGLAGVGAQQALSSAGLTAPTDSSSSYSNAEGTVARLPGSQTRYVVISRVRQMTALWDTLTQAGTIGPAAFWQWLDILDGLPSVNASTKESFLPQSLNLDLLDGVSFKKGCYPGQEIVARVRYLGRVKERMVRLRVDGTIVPGPGDALLSSSDAGRSIGTVVDAQAAPGGGSDLLAVVKTGVIEQWQAPESGQAPLETDLHIEAHDEKLRLPPQPYGLDRET